MIKDYDQEFGLDGVYAWPGCRDVAERFIEGAPYAKSSPDSLNDYFFYEYLDCLDAHLFDEYPEDEALELVEATAKSRQELFKEARNWPLPYLVASATYKLLSTKVDKISNLWSYLLWPFLCFDEPIFGMLRAKGWDKIYRNEIREEFTLRLRFEIDGLTNNPLMWGSEEGKPWFTGQCFTSHIYPEDILRCLDLIGIDRGLAHSAVDQVFKLQSLTPLYHVLSENPATGRHKGEEGEAGSPKKPYNTIIDRTDTWVEDSRIFTEGSPEVKAFRIELAEKGKSLPDDTSLCIHAQRTGGVIKITTQGTVTEFNRQERVMTYIVEHFRIDGQQVVKGDVHENDHVWPNTLANIGGLRDSDPIYDRARTVKMTHKLHALRTEHYRKVEPKYSLKGLTKPLSELLKPIEEADRELWNDKTHRNAIFEDGLTPKFLVEQYSEAHRYEVRRMEEDLRDKGFNPTQATAYIAEGIVREAMTSSADAFIFCRVQFPQLEDESVLDKLTTGQKEAADRCYLEKVRLRNLRELSTYCSECTALAGDFELYSDSLEGARGGCTALQTKRHRETKMEGIREFKRALKEGFIRGLQRGHISQTDLNDTADKMVADANVDKDGNSRAGELTTEALKDRIRMRGEGLRMNSLYRKDNVFIVKRPPPDKEKRLYKECVKSEALKLKETSTSSQQEASDQDYTFL